MKLKPKNKCRQLQNLSSVYKTKKPPKKQQTPISCTFWENIKITLTGINHSTHSKQKNKNWVQIVSKVPLSNWCFFFSPSGLPKFWLKLCGRSKNIHQEVHFTTRNRYYTTLGEIFSKYLLITHVKIYAFFVQNLYIFH